MGLAYFPDFRGVWTAVPLVGDLLPTADPLYLTSFGGAVVISTTATVVSAHVSTASFDFERLGDVGSRAMADGGDESGD